MYVFNKLGSQEVDILDMKGLVDLHLEPVVPCRWKSEHEKSV